MRLFLIMLCSVCLMVAVSAVFATPPPPNYQISSSFPQLQNEEQVWVSPVDSNVLIALWRDFRLGYRQVAVGRSTDAGHTWTDSLVRQTMYEYQSDPCVDVDREGTFWLAYLDYGPHGSSISFNFSTDNGASWLGPISLPSTLSSFEDKQFITIDRTGGPYDGNLYMAWARFCPNNDCDSIRFVRSVKGTYSFDPSYVIGPPPDFGDCGLTSYYGGQFAQPLVGSDGAVYVFWNSTDTTDCNYFGTIHMVKSTDGGLTMSQPKKVVNAFGNYGYVDGGIDAYNMPIAAADITGGPYDGNIYISYANMDTTNQTLWDYNIEFIRSSDGGDTWSTPYYINDDVTGPDAIADQFHPWLFCNEEGILIITFYDQRLDVLEHYKFDVFAAYSFDGGETFTTNHRISDVSSNPDQLTETKAEPRISAHPWNRSRDFITNASFKGSKAGKIAEYISVTAFGDHINAVWTDTRNGNQDVYGANWVLPILEPRLLAPKNGMNVTSPYPHFDWAMAWKMADDRYRVEVATDNRFINTVYTEMTDSAGLVSAVNALPDGLYYWRVKTFKISTLDSSDYSQVGHFTVGSYTCVDSDGDGFGAVGNSCPNDNCPNLFNLDQLDTDADGVGSACDNCPDKYNPGQEDGDADGIGDVCEYVCGDADGNKSVNILDVGFIISYLYRNGPAPDPKIAADADGNGSINILDVAFMISYLYKSGQSPICE